ncbi:MAG: glutamate synthase large subunit [Synergistaceae bacterium]|nr:glutamate synthase large subunit [Synergistaceae bacterium]
MGERIVHDPRKSKLNCLYDPKFEHDACGIGMLVDIKGVKSHGLVRDALKVLINLTHRAGVAADPDVGDGAGILIQIPHRFLKRDCEGRGINLPDESMYGVAMLFASPDGPRREKTLGIFENIVASEGMEVIGTRRVPTYPAAVGKTARDVCPAILQVFIRRPDGASREDFERKLYVVSKLALARIRNVKYMESDPYFYLASISSRTVVYKGMLIPRQMDAFYIDLRDEDVESAIALVHSRYSTNTFPSWERAHPIRHIIHNGEINTIRGNVNWIKARESVLKSEKYGADYEKLLPIINEDGSDSAMLDDFLTFMMNAGYTLPYALMMAIPEPWEKDESMDPDRKAFYEYASCLMEPWDGPAAIAFTDGVVAGARLDRNGLRPSRYFVTRNGTVILSSEVGVLPIPDSEIIRKDRLRPGRMLLVDTGEGRIIEDGEIKSAVASSAPFKKWVEENVLKLADLPQKRGPGKRWRDVMKEKREAGALSPYERALMKDLIGLESLFISTENADFEPCALLEAEKIFGYTWEDLTLILKPMAENADEPISSMGTDIPLAVLSERPQLLYNYFKQMFAQVTNPPLDALREANVTSSGVQFGSEGNMLAPGPENCRMIRHGTPVISDDELQKLRNIDERGFKAITLPMLFNSKLSGGLKKSLDNIMFAADIAVADGYNLIILSDRGAGENRVPIPALLATGGLHHHLIRKKMRTRVSIIVESGESREVHHLAALIGYGADAVNPYLAYRIIRDMADRRTIDAGSETAVANYMTALTKGIMKVISKMGISTVRSYQGAQIFEALGVSEQVVNEYFTGTATRIGGVTLDEIEGESLSRHENAFNSLMAGEPLDPGGEIKWRHGGERHLFNPESVYYLQQACLTGDYELFKKFSSIVSSRTDYLKNIRGLLNIVTRGKPISLDLVEPIESIVRRFKTGAMSYGSISPEAHECIARAMNRLGAKSNSGEGGEIPERWETRGDGQNSSSAIKQVASARFGVTIAYLNNAAEIQIKMAQGAKPGEGGHLPGTKVYPWIARARNSTPGVALISPPPHHDIYSIEDLAQLIYDLKNANSQAKISVKLVSEAGVGTIAVGVAKGLADVITISGYDGGTGASPRGSIRHTGLPWELGLAEAHQTLLLNNFRNRVTLETDGKLLTGRDVVIAALLGAEEFGFASAVLVALGCDMMKVCNLDTCPVGIATQNPALRKKFRGKPEHVENFMRFLAMEVREWMAMVGAQTFNELIGHVELLRVKYKIKDEKARTVDLSRLLSQPSQIERKEDRYFHFPQEHMLQRSLDRNTLIPLCMPRLERGEKIVSRFAIDNTNRTVGAMLSGEITRLYGTLGVPEDSVRLIFDGCAGQSFGAFLTRGVTLELRGQANDHVGKGLSGGRIIIVPPDGWTPEDGENVIIGNVALYGATSGEAYIRGVAGERFCVRNSGASAVVEGVGDHGCEYMTSGVALILGPTGKNFAAGMSGGTAYVYDPGGHLRDNCNTGLVSLIAPNGEDEKILRNMLERHFEYTGSGIAEAILKDFEKSAESFVKVVPDAYRKVLDTMKGARELGIPEEDVPLYAFNELRRGRPEEKKDMGARVMGKPTGFMEYERAEAAHRPADERIRDYFDFALRTDAGVITCQSARCMDCGVPFCHAGVTLRDGVIGCPLGSLIPEINDLVYRGDIEGAYERLTMTHPFPEFTSRVCPALCEGSCTLGEHEPPVTVKSIERYIVDYMLEGGKIRPRVPRMRTGRSVAVVGSGPSGLACADMLNRLGNDVTVFERADRPGGLLTFGIPNMKLEKSIVEDRIRIMAEENVKFALKTEVGMDMPVIRLLGEFDAVVLCCGAGNERKLDVPGSDLKGVHTAMRYLSASVKRLLGSASREDTLIDAKGKRVVVVGGGDTGTDCVATAVRQGASGVVQLEILPPLPESRAEDNPWPLWPRVRKMDYGIEEAIALYGEDPRHYLTTASEIKGSKGKVTAVVAVGVEWTANGGNLAPKPVRGAETEFPADMVITAMGFTGPERALIDQLQLEVDARGCVAASNSDYKSSLPTVFAAGDMRSGPSLVVRAIDEGRNAAIACNRYLNEEKNGKIANLII